MSENQHIMDDIDNSIAQAAKGTFTPPSGVQPWDDGKNNTAKVDLAISARKHADIIDIILASPTNSTAIEVKNVTLATASQLLRLLASTL